MTIGSALAIYFIIWWGVFFTVLPWGIRTQQEEGDVAPGTVPSAPMRPMMIRKALITSVLAGVVFAMLALLYQAGYRIEDLPLPGPR